MATMHIIHWLFCWLLLQLVGIVQHQHMESSVDLKIIKQRCGSQSINSADRSKEP